MENVDAVGELVMLIVLLDKMLDDCIVVELVRSVLVAPGLVRLVVVVETEVVVTVRGEELETLLIDADMVLVRESVLVADTVLVEENVLTEESVLVRDSVLVDENVVAEDKVLVKDSVLVEDNVLVALVTESVLAEDRVLLEDGVLVEGGVLVGDTDGCNGVAEDAGF